MSSDQQNDKINKALNSIKEISIKYPDNTNLLKEKLIKLLNVLKYPDRNQAQLDPSSAQSSSSLAEYPRTQNESERKKIDERLRGFSLNESAAWKDICDRFGPNLNQTELLSIAEVLCYEVNHSQRNFPLKVDREAKRRKEVLIKWFDENYVDLQPHLKTIVLEDENGLIIDPKRY